MVACAAMDKEEVISAKLVNVHNENELGVKFISFKWNSSTGIMNAIRMKHCNKECLRFEMMKGINVKDTVEHEHELESAKETPGNTEFNQRKLFLGR